MSVLKRNHFVFIVWILGTFCLYGNHAEQLTSKNVVTENISIVYPQTINENIGRKNNSKQLLQIIVPKQTVDINVFVVYPEETTTAISTSTTELPDLSTTTQLPDDEFYSTIINDEMLWDFSTTILPNEIITSSKVPDLETESTSIGIESNTVTDLPLTETTETLESNEVLQEQQQQQTKTTATPKNTKTLPNSLFRKPSLNKFQLIRNPITSTTTPLNRSLKPSVDRENNTLKISNKRASLLRQPPKSINFIQKLMVRNKNRQIAKAANENDAKKLITELITTTTQKPFGRPRSYLNAPIKMKSKQRRIIRTTTTSAPEMEFSSTEWNSLKLKSIKTKKKVPRRGQKKYTSNSH